MFRISELAQRITNKFSTEREKAVALHDYICRGKPLLHRQA